MAVSLNYRGDRYLLTDAGLQKYQGSVLVDGDLRAYDAGDYVQELGCDAGDWVRKAAEDNLSVGLDHPLVRRFLHPIH